MIIQENHYQSLYFQGGSWLESPQISNMKMSDNANDFTLQFWASGDSIIYNEAPALFSIINSTGSIKLVLYRDQGFPSNIILTINSQTYSVEMDDLDFSNPDTFYLISILFSDNKGIKCYINDNMLINYPNQSINVDDSQLMIGIRANELKTIRDHYWYGYIDEIRLWNTMLADSTIQFHYEYPNKLGDYYRYTYHDSLIGLWRFNLSTLTSTITDESNNQNNLTIYTINEDVSINLSNKGKN